MTKISQREIELNNLLDQHRQEAIKQIINAFNDGYLLGLKYGRMALEGDADENKGWLRRICADSVYLRQFCFCKRK